MKHFWNRFTDIFGRTIFHPQYIIKSMVYESIMLTKRYAKGKLVDIGCGRMPYRDELEPLVASYIGVDHPTVARLYKSERKPDVLADAAKLPFTNNTFDIALLVQVTEYLDSPQDVFGEIYRILKKKGKLIISSPFLYPIHDYPYDRARYTRPALISMLKQQSFRILTSLDQGQFIEFWIQSLQVFLFQQLQFILSGKIHFKEIVLLIFLSFALPFVIIVGNCIVFLVAPIERVFFTKRSSFPLNILIVAEK